MKMLSFLAIAAGAAWLTACESMNADGFGERPLQPYHFDYEKLDALLERTMRAKELYILRFERNSFGSKLFIHFEAKSGGSGTFHTAIISENALEIIQSGGVLLDDAGRPVMSEDGRPVKRGEWVKRFDSKDLSFYPFTGAQFILLQFPPKTNWVVVAAMDPEKRLIEMPAGDRQPDCLIATSNKLFVFWPSRIAKGKYVRWVSIYESSPAGFVLVDKIQLPPWVERVYDFDPDSENVLVAGLIGFFRSHYLYNLKTERKERLGFAPGDNLLLRTNVIGNLEQMLRTRRASEPQNRDDR
jgi:hypothetical protein